MIGRTTQQLFLDLAGAALRGGLIRRASRSLGEHVRSPVKGTSRTVGDRRHGDFARRWRTSIGPEHAADSAPRRFATACPTADRRDRLMGSRPRWLGSNMLVA